MNSHEFSFSGIYDLCRFHYEDIIMRKPLKNVLDNRRVRFVNPKGRFDYCYFGDFYFGSGSVMMLITNDPVYICYHCPDQLSNTLWSTVPVIFAGVETGVRDDVGNMIFTYDYCDFGMYRLMVQYMSFDEPCLLADNHKVPLSWAREHGGFHKSGTSLYDLRKEMFDCFDPWEIWHVNQYNDPDERQKACDALNEPLFIDGLPEPNKRWPRIYQSIDDVLEADTVLAYFKSSFKEDFVDESGEWHEDYVLFTDNYPYGFNRDRYEMVVENENYQQLVNDLLLKAHRTPDKCFVLCDFFENIVICEEYRNEYAQYFKPVMEYHISNVILPNWIIEEWIRDIEIEFYSNGFYYFCIKIKRMFMEKKIDRTNALISIQELLKGRDAGFDKAADSNPKSIKLVRHSDKVKENSILGKEYEGKSVYDLYRLHYPKFLEWQCEQNPKYMKKVHYLVVFIGEEQCTCRFIGVFKNNGPTGTTKEGVKYKLEEVKSDGFDLLKNQVVIEWGKSTQQFMHNWTTTKEVIQMFKAADTSGVPYFTRYEDILLDYSQLKKVVKDKEWKSKLEACNCVYVIADKKTGQQYVGVTYKNSKKGLKAGIWSRWSEYANNGHGGDIKLKELCTNNHKYAENYFQWSILEILPLNVIPKVAIDRETKWKDKLLSREFGYNNN